MEWTRGQIIGCGSSATVSIATNNLSGLPFAVKSAELSNSKSLRKEQAILSTLQCPQIVAYRGFDITQENGKQFYNLFMELAPYGSLIDAIRENGGCLEENLIRYYTKEILVGLEYLHSNGIVHCDIKCHNILVTASGAKIADLGCAKHVGANSPIAGTPAYMAPEVARGEQQSYPADIWAIGCTIIEMVTGKAPWSTNKSDPISVLYDTGFGDKVPEIPSFVSKEAKNFISKCLKRDPTERWSVSELLNHDFVNLELNCLTKEVNRNSCLMLKTPTTVLDTSFWKTEQDLNTSCVSSRIKQLCHGNEEALPNWDFDDDNWETVRRNYKHESTYTSQMATKAVSENSFNVSNICMTVSLWYPSIRGQEVVRTSEDCNLVYVNELDSDSETDMACLNSNEQELVVISSTLDISSSGNFSNYCSTQIVLDCLKEILIFYSNSKCSVQLFFVFLCLFIQFSVVSAAPLVV